MSTILFATAQMGDLMIINGEKKMIFSNPLDGYISKHKIEIKNTGVCSACWRGYIATWDVIDGYLYILGLDECTCSPNDKPIPLKKIFPHIKGDKVKAIWYSGEIRIPLGKQLEYVHGGYMSKYEKDLFFKFKNGKLIGKRVMDNRESPLDILR